MSFVIALFLLRRDSCMSENVSNRYVMECANCGSLINLMSSAISVIIESKSSLVDYATAYIC
jgi:hypothetical protein